MPNSNSQQVSGLIGRRVKSSSQNCSSTMSSIRTSLPPLPQGNPSRFPEYLSDSIKPLIGTQHAEVREHGYGLSFRAEHHPPPNGHSFGQGQRIGMRGLAGDSRVGRHV
ncbi:hypothetical protein CEXT_731351 [Caerostris extrusa]|uniref:Uncharacterized protein n=1 Tax=Caerostris extrusa TaxID=172846 RepID=A0AAV4X603_CAEEX|nr:hypothetical protein CEXT_731351 [Caerostris extrusa]